MNIILVDDDPIIRLGLRKIIEKSGLNCNIYAECSDGSDALKILKENTEIDLIVTDIKMNIMNGIELLHEVRHFNKTIKFIVLSGFDDFNYVRNAFQEGVVDYLLKPIKRDEFIHLLQKTIDLIHSEKESLISLTHKNIQDVEKTLELLYQNKKVRNYPSAFENFKYYFKDNYTLIYIEEDKKYYNKDYQNQLTKKHLQQALLNYPIQPLIYFLHEYHRGFICIIFQTNSMGDINTPLLHKYFNESLQDSTVSIGASCSKFGVDAINSACQEALLALDMRFYLGKNNYFLYQQLNLKQNKLNVDLDSKFRKLFHTFETANDFEVKTIIRSIFKDFKETYPSIFREEVTKLIDKMILKVPGFEKGIMKYHNNYKSFIEEINTLDELQNYIFTIVKDINQFLSEEQAYRSIKRIELAKQYIKENYMLTLTLNDVADYVELNPSYFSNLFSTAVGESFSSYLMTVRMEKALELLKDPKIKVYEIGQMVGYEDAISFSRAFKKKIGLTPKEYRKVVYI